MDRIKKFFRVGKKNTLYTASNRPAPGGKEHQLQQQQQWEQQLQKQRLLAQQEHEKMMRATAQELEEKIWGKYMQEYYPQNGCYFMPPHFLICDPVYDRERKPPTVLNWYEQEKKDIGDSRRRKKLRREEKKKQLKAGQKLPRRPRHKKKDPPPQPCRVFGDVLTGGGVSSVVQMLEEEHDRQRALALINKTVSIQHQPMTVLSQLWFRQFLDKDEVNPDRLVNPLYFTTFNLRPYLGPPPVELRDGEGDVVFMHRHRGVLIGEMILSEALGEEDRKEKEEKERKEKEEKEREQKEKEEKEKEEKERKEREQKEKEEKEKEEKERKEKEEKEKEEKEERENREKGGEEGASGGDDEEKMDEEREKKEEEEKMEEGGAETKRTGDNNDMEVEDKDNDNDNDNDKKKKEKKKREEKKRQKEEKEKEKERKKKKEKKEEENERKKAEEEEEEAEKMEEEEKARERYQPKDETELLRRLKNALLQIDNQEKAFRHLISDIYPSAPPHITRMIFLPSISRTRLELALSTSQEVYQMAVEVLARGDAHKLPQLLVCEEDMELTDGAYPPWFYQHFPGEVSNVDIPEDCYRKMLVRFLGPASTVDVMTACPSATEVRRLGKMRWPTYSRFSRPDPSDTDPALETAEHAAMSVTQGMMNTLRVQEPRAPQQQELAAATSVEPEPFNPDMTVAIWKPPPLPPPVPDDDEDGGDDDDEGDDYYYHDEMLYEYYYMMDRRFRHRFRLPPGLGLPEAADVDPDNEAQMEAHRQSILKVMREREKKRRIARKKEEAKRRREEATYRTLGEVYLPRPPKLYRRHLDQAKGESPLKVSALPLSPTQLSVLSELPSPKYLYLQGPPGCGKSVVMGMKALAWARQGKPVLLVVQGDMNAAATVLLERQLVDMLGDRAHLVRLHHVEFTPNMKVRSEVARIWRLHGHEVLIIVDQTTHRHTKEMVSWLVEIRKTGPDSRIVMADDFVRDRTQHEMIKLPDWFECRDVKDYRRYTKAIASMVNSRQDWRHMAFLHPPVGDLPAQPLRHHGIHGSYSTADQCNYCAHNLALLFNHLKVGQPGGELEYRDVLILVTSLYNNTTECSLMKSLRDDHGFPVVWIRGAPLKDGEVHEIAMGVSDHMLMTSVDLALGVGRKVVVVVDPDKMDSYTHLPNNGLSQNHLSHQAMARAHFLLPCIDAPRRVRVM